MINVLCTSYMGPRAKSGITTYYKNIQRFFENDQDIRVTLVTAGDVPIYLKRVAGFVRKLIVIFTLNNRYYREYSFEVKNRLIMYFVLFPHRHKTFDVIHAQDILSGLTAQKMFKDLPLILTCHFNDNPVEEAITNFNLDEKYRVRLDRRFRKRFKQVASFIFVSRYAHRKTEFLLSKEAIIEIIPNGVYFAEDFPVKHDFRKPLEKLHMLNVGYIDVRKNQRMFLLLAQLLIKKGLTDFMITLVGDGPDLEMIKQETSKPGLNSHFMFPGWIADVNAFRKDSNIYIHTAINDNCPYSVLEAIAHGLPVLGLNVGGMPEIIGAEWLFEPAETDKMADYFMEHRRNLQAIADKQYASAKDIFALKTQLERTGAIYKKFSGSFNPRPVSEATFSHHY